MNSNISIIVPIYNVPEEYLKRCVNSLVAQTYNDIEIILVDDGSTNNSPQICDEFAKNDKRILVIHKTNGGLSAARNTGYLSSSSEWIMFVDGDDWIEPQTCEEMIRATKQNDVQLVMCCMIKDYGHSSQPYKYYIKPNTIFDKSGCLWLQEQLLHFNGNIATAYCKLIKKDILDKNEILHNEELRQGAEGLEFNLRLFEHINSAIFLDKYLYHYLYNENSISVKHDEKNHQYVLNCFAKIKEIISQSHKESLMYWFNNRVLYVVITTAISGYFSPANSEKYSVKKKKYKEYLRHEIVQEAINSGCNNDMTKSRKIIIFFIKYRMFLVINLLAIIRAWQKKHK